MSREEQKIRVLIADDDALLRDIAIATFEGAGFEVEAVTTGNAAIAACAARMPDIALLDVEMPEGSGYEACVAIRELLGGASLPIVMITGHDDAVSIDKAYDAGATDFVVKPINWALIVHRIRYVLRGARNLDALRFSEKKNAALLRAIPDGIFLVDTLGAISHIVSPIPGLIDGTHAPGSRRLADLLPEVVQERAMACLNATLRGEPAAFEFAIEAESETTRHFECRYAPNAGGQVLAIIRDITARKRTEAHIHRLAYFDVLTGLPNREWLGDYLQQSLVEARRENRSVAVLYIDLDQFKRINDTLGHQTGDALLRMVTDRLHTLAGARGDDDVYGVFARVGGDEFILVLTGNATIGSAQRAAERIQAALVAPFLHGGYEFVVTPSIGIALFPEHGNDSQSLLKNADGAMYEAKASGRNQYRVYTSAVHARALKRLSLEMELRQAFENSQLQVYYQPKYETQSLRLIGAEALLRWFHPERGQIPTIDFVAVAEEIGLIGDMGRWVMQRVCWDLCAWRDQGLQLPRVAVNVSGRDFMRPEGLLHMSDTVGQARLSPSLFELELTEGILMQDAEAGRRSLLTLKEFGFALAVDDFGTGYSSLSYLKRFPLDTLKIDRSFVKDIGVDPEDAAICRAIIALGHNLGLGIVAEGVSSEVQLEFMRAEGCDAVQGWLMSAAMPANEFAELVRKQRVSAEAANVQPMRRATRAG
ncbi:MAG TPA: EAL domain-containing protein [Steroidobacteraceae bacterium]|nr:EAL domain-containing protein [Steroidobacteraceae bacterium]